MALLVGFSRLVRQCTGDTQHAAGLELCKDSLSYRQNNALPEFEYTLLEEAHGDPVEVPLELVPGRGLEPEHTLDAEL